eukprot:7224333-Prymnesium_polylepis.1
MPRPAAPVSPREGRGDTDFSGGVHSTRLGGHEPTHPPPRHRPTRSHTHEIQHRNNASAA